MSSIYFEIDNKFRLNTQIYDASPPNCRRVFFVLRRIFGGFSPFFFSNICRKVYKKCLDLPRFADLHVFSVKRAVSCGVDCVDSGFLHRNAYHNRNTNIIFVLWTFPNCLRKLWAVWKIGTTGSDDFPTRNLQIQTDHLRIRWDRSLSLYGSWISNQFRYVIYLYYKY